MTYGFYFGMHAVHLPLIGAPVTDEVVRRFRVRYGYEEEHMPCTNVMHNEVDCPTAGLPRKDWCTGCRIARQERDAALVDHPRIRRCERMARKGTGTGTCEGLLDPHGNCPNASNHTDEFGGEGV